MFWTGSEPVFFSLRYFGHFVAAEAVWSLKHFGLLSHRFIKTRRSSVHQPIFSDILTEMAKFISVISKTFRSMAEI